MVYGVVLRTRRVVGSSTVASTMALWLGIVAPIEELAATNANRPSPAGAAASSASSHSSTAGRRIAGELPLASAGWRKKGQTNVVIRAAGLLRRVEISGAIREPGSSRSGPRLMVRRTGGPGSNGCSEPVSGVLKGSVCPHPVRGRSAQRATETTPTAAGSVRQSLSSCVSGLREEVWRHQANGSRHRHTGVRFWDEAVPQPNAHAS